MAKAKKLPSGTWRVQVYSYTDSNGKKHRESFTAPTKAEAEMKAAEFAASKRRRSRHDLTVKEAIDGYINAKEGVLSPKTIREYKQMSHNYYSLLERKRLSSITSEDLQLWVSALSKERSPKSVRNVYGLLTAAFALYSPDTTFRVTLPAKQPKRLQSPSDEDIKALFEAANDRLKPCIALGICGIRRGEICALKYEDIKGGVADIHADMIQNSDNEWEYKPTPKTAGSNRLFKLPKGILDLIGEGKGYIITWYNPNSITQAFGRLRNKMGLNIRFHDLRHYYASIGAILGVPDLYLADMGGWRHDSKVMKEIYQNKIVSMSDHYADMMNNHISSIINNDS